MRFEIGKNRGKLRGSGDPTLLAGVTGPDKRRTRTQPDPAETVTAIAGAGAPGKEQNPVPVLMNKPGSGTVLRFTQGILQCKGIRERFPVMGCGDESRRGTPAPEIFLLAAQKLGKAPADCLGFEDSPSGLRALHAAGIKSIFVKDLVEPPPEVLTTVWRRCGDLAEAIPLIGAPLNSIHLKGRGPRMDTDEADKHG
jgi:beta-phosphoglucomutase-like phosphatase (HAD superfamily)